MKQGFTPRAEWVTPILFGVVDDRSRLACHLQWYTQDRREIVARGLSQAFQKRGSSGLSDDGTGWRADFRQGLAYPTVIRSTIRSQIMSRFWSSVVHSLSPYVPGEQPKLDGIVKLNTNENPYPPSPRVLAAIASATDRLRLYPDPRASTLC
jgi:hypothetical protein